MTDDMPTREQVLAEPPGLRLDGWVARYVMKWAPPPGRVSWEMPFSTSWNMAEAVVARVDAFYVEITRSGKEWEVTFGVGHDFTAPGSSLPHAVSRAAVLACLPPGQPDGGG